MKNLIYVFLLCALTVMGVQSCDKTGNNPSATLSGTAYTGVIPCADCQGIAYRLTLQDNHQFETRSVYIGHSNRPFIERGQWSKDGDSLLVLKNDEKKVRKFRIQNDQLLMLNQKGKAVQGSLAKMYVLNEADTAADHQWQKQREQGIDFRAAGNEPSWSLTIDFDNMMIFKTLSGDSVSMSVPPMKMDTTGKARLLSAKAEGSSLNVALYPTGCVDDMSGRVFTYGVKVSRADMTFRGCGNFINPKYKLNDFWSLNTLGGAKIDTMNAGPKTPALHFNVAQNKVSGNSGCNLLHGSISVKDNSLSFSKMASTKMACQGSMQLESDFTNALQKIDRYSINNDELMLMNAQDTLMVFRRTK